MRDNGNGGRFQRELVGSASGVGLVGVVTWIAPEYQVKSHEGFAPEAIHVRDGDDARTDEAARPSLRYAEPPIWTHRDDLPCTKRVPKGNQRDPYDESDPKKAKALCAGCPVADLCLADALAEEKGLSEHSRYLVRGGLTPKGRAELTSND